MGALSFDIASEGPAYDPMAHKGGLKLAGPPEALHALWFAADRDLADAAVRDGTVKQWANVFKSVACVFYYLPDDLSAHYHQETARDRAITMGSVVTPSGLQKFMQVIKIKEKFESLKGQKMTADQVHDEYKDKVQYSPMSEAFTKEYVKNAIEVYEKALSVPGVLDLVVGCEGNVFKRVYCSRCGFCVLIFTFNCRDFSHWAWHALD